MTKISLDTNIFICSLNKTDPRYKAANKILSQIKASKVQAIISILVFEEYLIKVYKHNQEKEIAFHEDMLVAGGRIGVVEMNRQIARQAAQIRAKHSSIRTPDAIHIATAIESKANIFITTDKRLPKKIGKLAIKVLE